MRLIWGEDRLIFSSSGRTMLPCFIGCMSRCGFSVSANRADVESVILAARRSRGILCISELAGWYIKEVAQSLTTNILGPIRKGPFRSQIMPEIQEVWVFPCRLLGSLLLL